MGGRFIKNWVVPVLGAVLLAILINKFLLFRVEVPTGSMEPTIKVGDKFLATKIYNFDNIKRGDILVFYNEECEKTMIKRLIGLPGDKIEIKGKDLFINGEKVEEDYVKHPQETIQSYSVPEEKYFFLGDNRANSSDARYWANPYIDQSDIEGKAQIRISPIGNFGSIN
ncbi:MAG: signal peptidase I [Clostridium sp.]|uniref:signal peptidase I n=1 Tax=Clostridium sp. TaxID=1506 RepID=UPI003F330333